MLTAEEVPAFLSGVFADWRDLFACALYTGMRKGELFALRKADVDPRAGAITVARSNERETTKGAHADLIPIAPALRPYLRHAFEVSTSELVFPRPDGSQWPEAKKMTPLVRVALKSAGLVTGYDHICRRCKGKGQPSTWRHPDAVERRCPTCGMRLWPRPPSRGRFGSTTSGTRPRR